MTPTASDGTGQRPFLLRLRQASVLIAALAVSLASGMAGAVVLGFESQPPGAPITVIEGDYSISGVSVEPLGPFCPTPGAAPCPSSSNGQYIFAPSGGTITLARTDGAPFDLESFSYDTFLNFGLVIVNGVDAQGNPVSTGFNTVLSGFNGNGVLTSDFDEVVSVSFELVGGTLNLGLDDISIADPPPDPFVGAPGTMILVSDDRRIDASGRSCVFVPPDNENCGPAENDTATPSPPFTPFSASVTAGAGAANQTSTATTGELAGSGGASGAADLSGQTSTNGAGNAFYDVQFQVLAPTRIRIAGSLSNFDTSGGGIGGGITRFTLTRGGTTVYASSIATDEPDAVLDFDQVVPAGIYRVVVHADGYIWVQSGFDFTLVANPTNLVPALSPITLGALLTGLLSLSAAAMRRANTRAGTAD